MSGAKPSSFRDLKASFESRSRPITATAYRSVAGDLANMSTQQRTSQVASLAKSIDSVLDTPPASPPTRPPTVLRPSWIGPRPSERPVTPGLAAMKQIVTVEYSSPGLQPPVYIFTSLSDPQWEPVEMHRETDDRGGYIFSKTFHVEEGEYQYKFRLGEGDWWACDSSKPLVDDGQGNENNLLILTYESPLKGLANNEHVKSQEPKILPGSTNITTVPQSAPDALGIVALPKLVLQPLSGITSANHELSVPAPMLKHEMFDTHKGSAAEQTPEREEPNPLESDDDPFVSTNLTKHESPLLRHESVKPSSAEQEHAPLFRHESISYCYNHHEAPARDISSLKIPATPTSSPPIAPEADPLDETLEEFPTDHDGIMWKIRHAHKRLPEDQTSDEHALDSPGSQAISDSSTSAPASPIVHTAVDDILERIREAEQEEIGHEEATGEEVDPLRSLSPMTPPMTPPEAEDADFEPKTDHDTLPAEEEIVQIEEKIIIEIVEQRKGVVEVLLDRIGGKGNAIVMALGLLVIAAGICTMQFL